MKIELNLDYDEALDLHARLAKSKPMTDAFNADLLQATEEALDNENERRWEAQQEERMNPDNDSADVAYRASLKDAGRGHLLR